MNSTSLINVGVLVFALATVVVAVRKLVLGPVSNGEFRKQFRTAWGWTGIFVAGTIWLVVSATQPKLGVLSILVTVGAIIFLGFMLTAYPMSWLAHRLYERTRANPDFAEDASGNSMPASPEEDPNEEPVASWRDVIRAERRRRG